MESLYKDELDRVHAPKELIQKTVEQMKAQKKAPQKKKVFLTVLAACAAMVCISIYGYQNYRSNNYIVVGTMAQEGLTLDKNMGVHGVKEESTELEGYHIVSAASKTIVPEELWDVATSKIKGNIVWIGLQEDKTTYCAAFKDTGKYYYIEKKEGNKKDFVDFLKKNYF